MEVTITQIERLVGVSWAKYLVGEFRKPYMKELMSVLKEERKKFNVYPAGENVFRALKETPLDTVKVVIVGQDPYHTAGMADGLCFSVMDENAKTPPSLVNIFRELDADFNDMGSQDGLPWDPGASNDLTRWARQGVLMLNTILTVRQGVALSHEKIGWQQFTNVVLKTIADHVKIVVWVGWGANAQKAILPHARALDLYIRSVHPSPLSASRGFFGSKPFSKINKHLKMRGTTPISWYKEANNNII